MHLGIGEISLVCQRKPTQEWSSRTSLAKKYWTQDSRRLNKHSMTSDLDTDVFLSDSVSNLSGQMCLL